MESLIKNIDYLKQVISYDGIKSNKISPTDIDALLEFDDKYLIIFELKYKGAKVPIGQKLALERIIKNWKLSSTSYRNGWVIYAQHESEKGEIIYLKDCKVTSIFSDKEASFQKPVDMVRFLNYLSDKHNIKKLKI